jgi:hypothetical protein
MRRLAVTTLAITLSGCLVRNPEYDEGTASASGSGGTTGGSTGVTPTTAPPTTGASDGSGSAGESTGGEVTTDPVATGEPTGGMAGSTGAAGSTGEPPPPECDMKEEFPLTVAPIDTGVVPATMGMPCPWGGAVGCEGLNFGITEFYRLVNDGVAGKNAALILFPREEVIEEIVAAGHDPANLIGVRLEFVVWEQIQKPLDLIELQIDLLSAGDSNWVPGLGNATPAVGIDPSFLCRQTENCAKWTAADGGPLASALPLGSLFVDPVDHPGLDKDQPDESQYHMQIRSEPLDGAAIRDRIAEGLSPAFAVSLKSVRELGQQVFGIKLYEAPWEGPILWVEMCKEWR